MKTVLISVTDSANINTILKDWLHRSKLAMGKGIVSETETKELIQWCQQFSDIMDNEGKIKIDS
mgnify:CR=1 FL=1|tara:strand:- start:1150 stop:1341 length:192 start_codon:yes stop_codon:yes gene_type:complete